MRDETNRADIDVDDERKEAGGYVVTTRTAERKQFLFDVFVTALEGGVNYWADVEGYHWSNPDGSEDLDGFRATITDREEPGGQLVVDADVIARGIGRFEPLARQRGADDYWRQFLAANRTNGDDGDYDATVADVIVQLALFGEIVYG